MLVEGLLSQREMALRTVSLIKSQGPNSQSCESNFLFGRLRLRGPMKLASGKIWSSKVSFRNWTGLEGRRVQGASFAGSC